jgi:dihydrofolate reductase
LQLSIIAALSENYVIGQQNQLPWHLPADLKHFKTITWGKPILMGRKTYESIGKALPGRRNIIITRNPQFQAEGCEITWSLEQALSLVKDSEEVMVIGGAELFAQALPKASRLYLTMIRHHFAGDCFFPPWDSKQWQEVERVDFAADDSFPYGFSFLVLDRNL